MSDQLDLLTWCQRWIERQSRWAPRHVLARAEDYTVEEIDERAAHAFVTRHHYSGTLAPTSALYGLYYCHGLGRSELVGVATFGASCNERVIPSWAGFGPREGLELSRLVLLDWVPYNAESMFVARCFKLLRRARTRRKDGGIELRVILSYSDPVERRRADGSILMPGHRGGVYQALNAAYLGRSSPRTQILDPQGRIVSQRALTKLRTEDKGWRYAERQISEATGLKRLPLETGESFATRCLASPLLTRQRHPGNHVYLWHLDRRRDPMPLSLPYPK